MLELLRLELSISDHRLVVNFLSVILACITAKQQTSAKDCYRSSCTVKLCHYGHLVIKATFFGRPAKRPYILCKIAVVNIITC